MYSFVARVGLVIIAISASTTVGLSLTPFRQDLKLSAQMGISPDVMLVQKKSIHRIAHEGNLDDIISEYVEIPIDHGDLSVGTYENRYWVSDKYYQPGGPVFIYDVGESGALSSAKFQLGNNSLLASMLDEFGGMGIVWEHRYYGDSSPYPITNDTPPEQFEFLNNRQALADIPFFAQSFSHPSYKNVDLTPSATPWVMVGGSYSGMRAAFTRNEYPDTIFASFASSAPVEARIDMSIYFEQIYASMIANGRFNCTRDMKAAYEWIDGELGKNESTAADVKKLFFGNGAEVNSNGDFTAALAGVYGFFQAYGLGGGEGGLGALCDHMETDEASGIVAGSRGFAPSRGKEYVARRFASWPIFLDLINLNYNTNCGRVDPDKPLECALNPKSTDPDTIAWTWQFCTEWGYYQSNNVGPHSLLSSFQTLDYIQYTCDRQFPEAVAKDILPKHPEVDATNYQTGGWKIRPSNVYWSGGQFDPWRTLSTLATESIAPQDITFTIDVPRCNVETDENTVFGYIMQDAEHCFDFQMNFAPGNTSREIFHEALTEWLPCFSPTKSMKSLDA